MTYKSKRTDRGSRPETIECEGRIFNFVIVQRGDESAVYRSDDAYMRIGDPKRIHADLAQHSKMEALGFPVARVIAEGEHYGQAYSIEASLGGRHLGALFAEDVEQKGQITNEAFQHLQRVTERFAQAQVKTVVATEPHAFARGIRLEELKKEMPEHAPQLERRFQSAIERLGSTPYVLTHGDFNPNNLYPTGVIDLEDVFYAPYGYDLISAIAHIDDFPDASPREEYEHTAKYRFTNEQELHYIRRLDGMWQKHGIQPLVSAVEQELRFCRTVWACSGISHLPHLRRFRWKRLKEQFLS